MLLFALNIKDIYGRIMIYFEIPSINFIIGSAKYDANGSNRIVLNYFVNSFNFCYYYLFSVFHFFALLIFDVYIQSLRYLFFHLLMILGMLGTNHF